MTGEVPTVGVVGLGYVGVPLAVAFADAGYDVVGVDTDADRVEALRSGRSTVEDVSGGRLRDHLGNGLDLSATYDDLEGVDAVSICVPTPLHTNTEAPDMSFVADAAERLATRIDEGTTVVLESTVYPGATEEVVAACLEDAGFEVGEDAYVAFSPERIDPGNDEYGIREIPKVLGGVTDACGDRAEALYDPVFDEIVRVDTAAEAELAKLLENTFRAVNIAFVNELAILAHALDVDVWDVIDAAATKPFGFMPFYPGPGFGGHCIPIDPAFLTWKAHKLGVETNFIELAARVNHRMPRFVVGRVEDLLEERDERLAESEVLVLGVAYKPGVADTRESPAHEVIALLEQAGATVTYHDPHVPAFETNARTHESVELSQERLSAADCVILLTNHPEVDLDAVVRDASLVLDTRNATAGLDGAGVSTL